MPSGGDTCLRGRTCNPINLLDLAKQHAVLSQHYTISVSFMVKGLVMMGRYPHLNSNHQLMQYQQQLMVLARKLGNGYSSRGNKL